jgi:hypothetical protein
MTQKNRRLINVAIIIFTACFAIVVAEIFTYNPRLFNLIPFFGQSKLAPLEESAFNVTTLLTGGMSDIEEQLGQPLEEQPATFSADVKTWRKTYQAEKNEIVVTYDVKTNQPVSFFIATDDPSGKTNDKERLLKLGELSENNPQYDVVFVKTAEDPNYFTGVKVIPK